MKVWFVVCLHCELRAVGKLQSRLSGVGTDCLAQGHLNCGCPVERRSLCAIPYTALKSPRCSNSLSAPLLTTVEYFKSDLIATAVEWCVMRRWAQCLLKLCSALVDLRGQASNLFIAVLWVSEEMGMWGARLASGEDSFSQPD